MKIADTELHRLLMAAVKDGVGVLNDYLSKNRYVPTLHEHPTVKGTSRAGFPNVSYSYISAGPPDYKSLFKPSRNENLGPTAATYDELPSWESASEYMRTHPLLRSVFDWDLDDDDMAQQLGRMSRMGVIESLLDRYVSLADLADWHVETFTSAYHKIEDWLLQDAHPVTVCVPIALTRFDAESLELMPGIMIERMDDGTTAARLRSRTDTISPVPRPILEAATHALKIEGVEWPRPSLGGFFARSDDPYPRELIDTFFEALRVVTGIDTGYAQMFVLPDGWADRYVRDLPPCILGPVVRRYPHRFDDHGWNVEDRRVVSTEETVRVGEVLSQLLQAPRQLRLAAARVSSAMLDRRIDDAVVDACIALEAMLGGGDRGETTHKIALRGAAIVSLARKPLPPDIVFELIKQAYGYRSDIVHGRDPDKSKKRTWSDGEHTFSTSSVAVVLAREILQARLSNPEWADTQDIDRKLVAASIGRPRQSE